MNTAFLDYFRCPDSYADLRPTAPITTDPRFFSFNGIKCFGRTAGECRKSRSHQNEVGESVRGNRQTTYLPFDPTEVATNLRYERYVSVSSPDLNTPPRVKEGLARRIYYLIRPLLPVTVRKHLQKLALRNWHTIDFPAWPVDMTVDAMFREVLRLRLLTSGEEKIPFIWFWPDGYRACLIMTHDVETEAGRDFCDELMDLNDTAGIRSSFQIVPEKRYAVSEDFVNNVIERGHEVNVHGLCHDGHLFEDHEEFLRRAERINVYAAAYGAAGFRSPIMYRNAEWMPALDFAYDMSFPNTAHLDPQRGGCATIMPYFIGDLLELPLTMIQDYTMFNILQRSSIDLWQHQADILIENNGLISFIVHPDYVIAPRYRSVYESLLEYLEKLCREQNIINLLPRDLNTWWRQRSRMRIVGAKGSWRIEGEGAKRARVAYAMLRGNRLVFEVGREITEAQGRPLAAAREMSA